MKVLLIIDGLRKGGTQRRFCEVAKGLSIRKFDCEIIALNDVVDYPYIYDYGYKVHIFGRSLKKDPSVFFKIFRIVKNFKPDIIHSWGTMSPIYLLPTVLLTRVPFVNSMIYDSRRPLFSKIDFRARLVFPFSDVILANSYAGLKAYKANPRKTKVIYNGFDFKRITNLKLKEDIRKELGINTSVTVGMVSSFNHYKDYETYIKVAIKMCTANADLTFVSVGDGQLLSEMKALVPDELKNRILFAGMIMDVESVVNVFDICVLSTFGEGISNSILEYMALGKPVIATNLGGTSETIVEGVTGYLVPKSSPDLMQEKIQTLIDDPKLREIMGEEGKKRVESVFSFENMVGSTIEVYNELLAK